ncbi:MAG: amino acid permease, partial [Gemmatimonadales bacterium]
MSLFARKSVSQILEESASSDLTLRRALGKWQLTALGVGAVIGAGIFATTGTAIVGDQLRLGAGPAIVLSFLITAFACGLAAMCYAEFAAMVPISGSAYTYAYASLGEFVAWIIGWDLIIEYAVGNIAVAISWAGHFRELLTHVGLQIPAWASIDYRTAFQAAAAVGEGASDPGTVFLASAVTDAPRLFGVPFIFNLPAVAIVVALTAL